MGLRRAIKRALYALADATRERGALTREKRLVLRQRRKGGALDSGTATPSTAALPDPSATMSEAERGIQETLRTLGVSPTFDPAAFDAEMAEERRKAGLDASRKVTVTYPNRDIGVQPGDSFAWQIGDSPVKVTAIEAGVEPSTGAEFVRFATPLPRGVPAEWRSNDPNGLLADMARQGWKHIGKNALLITEEPEPVNDALSLFLAERYPHEIRDAETADQMAIRLLTPWDGSEEAWERMRKVRSDDPGLVQQGTNEAKERAAEGSAEA